jgi:hypothetical protein
MKPLLASLKERKWDGVIVGFGVRGGNTLEVTIHFESEWTHIRLFVFVCVVVEATAS